MLSRRVLRKAFLVVVLAATVAPAFSDELEPVQRDVLELSQAMYRGDFDTILRFSHPKAIEMLGGPTAARARMEMALQPILDIGMTLEAFSFPRPPE